MPLEPPSAGRYLAGAAVLCISVLLPFIVSLARKGKKPAGRSRVAPAVV